MLGQVDVFVCLSLLEISLQILIADIVDKVILGMDLTNVYEFIVDLRGNVLRAGKQEIKFCMVKMTGCPPTIGSSK